MAVCYVIQSKTTWCYVISPKFSKHLMSDLVSGPLLLYYIFHYDWSQIKCAQIIAAVAAQLNAMADTGIHNTILLVMFFVKKKFNSKCI